MQERDIQFGPTPISLFRLLKGNRKFSSGIDKRELNQKFEVASSRISESWVLRRTKPEAWGRQHSVSKEEGGEGDQEMVFKSQPNRRRQTREKFIMETKG